MKDVIGSVIVEMSEETTITDILERGDGDIRIRGQEEAPGDTKTPTQWVPKIRIVTLATPRLTPRIPIQKSRYAVTLYGRTKEEAEELYDRVHEFLHERGVREGTGDYWIYQSFDDTGGSYFADPDTKQPAYTFVLELLATTQAVTV